MPGAKRPKAAPALGAVPPDLPVCRFSSAGVPGQSLRCRTRALSFDVIGRARVGVLLAGEGLQPSSKGARVRFSGAKRTVIDGQFSETKELVAGFWLLQVKSREEAIEWIKRSPNPFPGKESAIEIRQLFEAEDLGPALTPETREAEERMRKGILAPPD